MRTYAKLTLIAFLFFTAFSTSLSAQKIEYGKASYYDDAYQGGMMASGKKYDKSKLTAAHRTLKFGTQVKVTRLDNKKSVVVTIQDRGPFIKGRIVDISKSAAAKIGLTMDGIAEVKLEVLKKGNDSAPIVSNTPTEYNNTSTNAVEERKAKIAGAKAAGSKKSESKISITDKEKEKAAKLAAAKKAKAAADKLEAERAATAALVAKGKEVETKKASPSMTLRTDKNYKTHDLYKVSLDRPVKEGFGVQVANMTDYQNALKKIAELEGKWFKDILMSIEEGENGSTNYKIILGYFDTQEKANAYKKQLKKNKKIAGFVVDFNNLK